MITPGPGASLDVRTVPLAGPGSGQLVSGPGVWLLGWTIANLSATTAAEVIVYSGSNDTGEVIAHLAVPAGFTNNQGPSTPGTPAPGGVYVVVVAGAISGAMIIGRDAHT